MVSVDKLKVGDTVLMKVMGSFDLLGTIHQIIDDKYIHLVKVVELSHDNSYEEDEIIKVKVEDIIEGSLYTI